MRALLDDPSLVEHQDLVGLTNRTQAMSHDETGPSAQEHRERLLREAKLLARIDHPNVVRVLDAGEEDGEAYLVMELVIGRTLRSHLRDGIVAGAVIEIGVQMARALGTKKFHDIVEQLKLDLMV